MLRLRAATWGERSGKDTELFFATRDEVPTLAVFTFPEFRNTAGNDTEYRPSITLPLDLEDISALFHAVPFKRLRLLSLLSINKLPESLPAASV